MQKPSGYDEAPVMGNYEKISRVDMFWRSRKWKNVLHQMVMLTLM